MLNTEKKDYCQARLSGCVESCDEELFHVLGLEDERQRRKLIMIASESECPLPVRQVLACSFTNIYAEGYPSRRLFRETGENLPDLADQLSYLRRYSDRRYYKGVEYADVVEALASKRAAALFANERIKAEDLFVNVQPLSGAAANNAVYEAFVNPGDTVMGMDLTHGGHLTHGSSANRSGKNYNIVSYHADYITGEIDFKELEELVFKHRPKMIIAGYSAYPRLIDWQRFRDISDSVGAVLFADISHVAGLIAGKVFPSPVGIADVISFTTHKTMCGPRGAVIMTSREDYADKVNSAVFPGEQGGPHLNSIAAKALLFRLANTEGFRLMQSQVVKNAAALAKIFEGLGGKLAYGGTDSHMVLLDLRTMKGPDGFNLRGEIASRVLDICGITCNKNTIPGDTSAVHPGALRFGTTWITQRGFKEEHVEELGRIIMELLAEMIPYKYIEISGDVGRAKTPLKAIVDACGRVEKLIEKAEHSELGEASPYPYWMHYDSRLSYESPINHGGIESIEHFGIKLPLTYPDYNKSADIFMTDASNWGIFEIRGDRSQYFLDEVTTIRVSAMNPGETKRCWLLSETGNVVSFALIAKTAVKRCFMLVPPDKKSIVLPVLRGLADGYILFDDKDIYAKIQGPCVVEDRSRPLFREELLTAVEIAGDFNLIEKLSASGIKAEKGRVVKDSFANVEYIAAACPSGKNVKILVHPDYAQEIWDALKKKIIEPIGYRDMLELKAKFTEFSTPATAEEAYRLSKGTEMIEMGKPYFLGQKYLNAKFPCEVSKEIFSYSPKDEPLKYTCLYEKHKSLGARMAPFAGYDMPVWYTSINEEHKTVRTAAGLFDVSHMGILEFEGRDACRFLDMATTNYIPKLLTGQSQYGYMLSPDGETLDDVMLYRRGEEKFMLVVNAANADKIKSWLSALMTGRYLIDRDMPGKEVAFEVAIRDLGDPSCGDERKVDLALQGPNSYFIIRSLLEGEAAFRFERLKRNEFIETSVRGMNVIISRTGYTGEEYGYELYLHPNDAVTIWDLILREGKDYGAKPCGLGCRDSARTEAGLPLYGHELEGDYGVTPLEAGYAPFVKFHKPFFIGRKAMLESDKKRRMEIVRFKMLNKNIRVVKHGSILVSKRGETMGYVTSCVIIDGMQYGLAYVNKRFAVPGTKAEVFILGGGKLLEKQKPDLKVGDKVVLSEDAAILTRFPTKDEFKERYGC